MTQPINNKQKTLANEPEFFVYTDKRELLYIVTLFKLTPMQLHKQKLVISTYTKLLDKKGKNKSDIIVDTIYELTQNIKN